MSFSLKPKEVVLEVEPPKGGLKNPEDVAILDIDYIKYAVASKGESRSIKVTHKASGNVKEFSTRTEFYGRDKKKSGGWLGELNVTRPKDKQFSAEDFEIEDVQTPEPIENVLHSAKVMGLGAVELLGTDKYEAYIGKGQSFRVGLSTLMEYKGNRTDTIKPLALGAVSEYITKRFNCKVVQGIEADDAVVMRAYGDPNAVIVGIDKDYWGQPVKFFNVNEPDRGVVDCNCFGKLWIEGAGSKEKIKGYGRLFMYWQIISEDTADNYKFSCHSDKKWAGKSAYKVLYECKTDKEALEVMIGVAKDLYPEPKTILNWKGFPVTIDWLYVLRECFLMARMRLHEHDMTTLDDYFIEYGVEVNT